MHFRLLILVCFFGLGLAKVQIKQHSLRNKYQVGDSAVLHCNLTSDTEMVRGCTMMWKMWDTDAKSHVRISKMQKYQHRVNFSFQGTFTSMTVNDLMVTDTENILCTATCFVNEEIQYISSNGTILTIAEQELKSAEQQSTLAPPWLKYLIFSINLLIFTIALGIFILVIRKSNRRK